MTPPRPITVNYLLLLSEMSILLLCVIDGNAHTWAVDVTQAALTLSLYMFCHAWLTEHRAQQPPGNRNTTTKEQP